MLGGASVNSADGHERSAAHAGSVYGACTERVRSAYGAHAEHVRSTAKEGGVTRCTGSLQHLLKLYTDISTELESHIRAWQARSSVVANPALLLEEGTSGASAHAPGARGQVAHVASGEPTLQEQGCLAIEALAAAGGAVGANGGFGGGLRRS